MTEADVAPIEFWFDFTSPYAYFASLEVEEAASRHRRTVLWRPFLLGAVFKTTGMHALTGMPLRGDYARRDWERLARRAGAPFTFPEIHPANTVAAGRAALWIEDNDPARAVPFSQAVFAAHFGRGEDIGPAAKVVAIASAAGVDAEGLAAGIETPALKDRFRARNDEALARGIFGSPFFIVAGEPFWGADRLPMVEEWLTRGGW